MVNALLPLRNMDPLFEGFFAPRRGHRCEIDADRKVRHVPRADIMESEKDYLVRLAWEQLSPRGELR